MSCVSHLYKCGSVDVWFGGRVQTDLLGQVCLGRGHLEGIFPAGRSSSGGGGGFVVVLSPPP